MKIKIMQKQQTGDSGTESFKIVTRRRSDRIAKTRRRSDISKTISIDLVEEQITDTSTKNDTTKKTDLSRKKSIACKKKKSDETAKTNTDVAGKEAAASKDTTKGKQVASDDDFETPPSKTTAKRKPASKTTTKRKQVASDDDFQTPPSKTIAKRKPTKDVKAKPSKKAVKRKLSASDDDFESPPSKRSRKKPNAIPRKPFVEYTNHTLYLRCDPGNFLKVTKNLSDAQKAAVVEMGFESLISLDILHIPSRLAFWLLQNFNEDTNELNVGSHKIKITPSLVHECLGIPMGEVEVVEKNKPRKGYCERLDEFKNQFDSPRISVIKVINLVKASSSAGRVFKTNFLVIFSTLMGEATKCSTINQRFMNFIEDDSEIPKLNWCKYIMCCLRRTKKGWHGGKDQYNGPILFLVVLYTHLYHKRHPEFANVQIQTPAIKYIDTKALYKMDEFLYNNGPLTDNEAGDVEKDVNQGRGNEIDEAGDKEEDHNNVEKEGLAGKAAGVAMDAAELVVDAAARSSDIGMAGLAGKASGVAMDATVMVVDIGSQTGKTAAELAKNDAKNDENVETGKNDENVDNSQHTEDFDNSLNSSIPRSPLDLENMVVGTETQRFIDDCITPVPLSGLSAYLGTGYRAKEQQWLSNLENHIEQYKKLGEVINNMVKEGKAKYTWNDAILNMCKEWENQNPQSQSSTDNNTVISLNDPQVIAETEKEVEVEGNATHVEHETTNEGAEVEKNTNDVGDVKSDFAEKSEVQQSVTATMEKQIEITCQEVEIQHIVAKEACLGFQNFAAVKDKWTVIPISKKQDDAKLKTKDNLKLDKKDVGGKADELVNVVKVAPSSMMDAFPAFRIREDKEVVTDCTPQQQGREKRTTKVTSAYKSPYVKRKVELGQKLSDEETIIAEYIFFPIDELIFVYKSMHGSEIIKVIFESLYEGVKLTSTVIDVWSEVLNDEEKLKSRTSQKRFFCSTTILLEQHFKLTEEKLFDMFKSNMDDYLKRFKVKSLTDIDLLFFPILASEHFYVLCFHLKVGKIVLMDNSKMGDNFDDRYKGIPHKLRNALCNYMRVSKIKTGLKKMIRADINRLQMEWRTEENKIDCGVFAMRHMETYMGNDKWDCGFSLKEDVQIEELKELRYKFLSKMLLSDINSARNDLITEALKVEAMETESKEALKKNLIDQIKERQSSYV